MIQVVCPVMAHGCLLYFFMFRLCDGGSFISSAVLEADLLELYFNLDLGRGNRLFGRGWN